MNNEEWDPTGKFGRMITWALVLGFIVVFWMGVVKVGQVIFS